MQYKTGKCDGTTTPYPDPYLAQCLCYPRPTWEYYAPDLFNSSLGCQLATPAEACNGIDDNCNGSVDEGCPERCDGIDNNANGRVDEGCPEICGNGKDDNSDNQIDEGCAEICGNGIDDNKNGELDEGCEPLTPPDATLGSLDPLQEMNNGCSIGDWAGKDPVQLSNRSAVTEPFTDFEATVLGRLAITRTYASADALKPVVTPGLFGIGWHHNWEMSLTCSDGGQACTLEGNLAAPRKFALQSGTYLGVGELANESMALYRRSEPEASGFGGHDLMVRTNGQFIVFLSDGSELRFSSAGCSSCMGADLNGKARLVRLTDADGEWVNVSYDTSGYLIALEDELGNSLAIASSSSCSTRAKRLAYRSGPSGTYADYITYEYDSTCELLVRAAPVGYTPAPGKTAQLRAYDYQSTPRKGLLTAVRNELNDPVVEFGYLASGEVNSFVDEESKGTVSRTQPAQDLVQSQVSSTSRIDTTHTRGAGWKANQTQSALTGLPAVDLSRKLAWRGRFLTCSEDASGLRYFERDAHGRVVGVADLVPPSRGGMYSCSSSASPNLTSASRHVKYEYGASKVVAEGIVLSLDTETATARRSVFTSQLTNTSGSKSWQYPTREALDFDPTPKATDPAGYSCVPAGSPAGSRYDLGGGQVAVGKLRPCRRTVSGYVLDAGGNPALRQVVTYLSYDARGRLTRAIGPIIGTGTQFAVAASDPVEERSYWADDGVDPRRGRLKEVRRWASGWSSSDPTAGSSLATTFEAYDVFGPTQIRQPGTGNRLTILTRAGGAGRVTRIDNPDGTFTTIRYYDGDKARLVFLPGGSVRRMTYDSRGRLATTEQLSGDPEAPNATPTVGWKESSEYDLAGNVTLRSRADGAGAVKWRQATTYDARHRPWKAEHPEPGRGAAESLYGPAGLLTWYEDQDWRAVSPSYDELGRVTRIWGRKFSGPPGTARSEQLKFGADYLYEPNQDSIREVYGTEDHSLLLARYVHDDFGRLASVRGYSYSHDARGNVLRRTGGGRVLDYKYDGLSRLTELTATRLVDAATIRHTYAYDDPANPALLHTVTEPDRTTTLTYDAMGRVRREQVAEAGVATALTTEYLYDADGDLTGVITPAGLRVKYVRNALTKEVTEVSNEATGRKYAGAVKHLPWGPVTDLAFSNGESLAAGFNLRYEPFAISSGTLALSYTMSPGGDVQAAGATSFTYDVPDRMDSATLGAGQYASLSYTYVANILREAWTVEANPKRRYAYHHDAAENLSAVSEYDLAGATILRTTCFVHDALGRLTTVGPARATPATATDLACQTEADVSSVSVRFRYDHRNRRVARQDGTGPWKHWAFTPNGQPLAELEKPATSQGAWTTLREYVWLEGRPVAQIEYPGPAGGTEGHVYAVHTDHLGQPRILTSRTGVVVWSAPVERPYGEVTETVAVDPASGRQVATNLRLPGQYDERLLAAAGIQGPYYNWNRWYLPSMGRYMELDPIAVAGGFNGRYGPDWYGYAEGNPLRYTDPTGRIAPWLAMGLGGGAAGAISATLAGFQRGERGWELAASAGIGFAEGFIQGMVPMPGLLSGVLFGAASNAVVTYTHQRLFGDRERRACTADPVVPGSVYRDAWFGALGGSVASMLQARGAFAGKGFTQAFVSQASSLLGPWVFPDEWAVP